MEQAAKAPFDEKLSVIGLILAKLNVEFGKSTKKENYLEMLFGKLKEYKARLAEADEPFAAFTALSDEVQADYEQKKKAGLLTREDQYRYRDVLDTMNRYYQSAKGEGLVDGEEIFAKFTGMFGEEREQFEAQCEAALQMLEYAFDFMEGTFEDSQEMVIFITELNTSFHAVKFLSENECERYFRYNSRLLFDNRAADIMKKLDRLGEF